MSTQQLSYGEALAVKVLAVPFGTESGANSQREDWPQIAAIINRLVIAASDGSTPISDLVRAAEPIVHSTLALTQKTAPWSFRFLELDGRHT